MSYVITRPEALAMAAQNTAAAVATTQLSPAAADVVSASTTTQFNAHAVTYQTVGVQTMAVHELFTAILRASAGSCAATETANAIAVS